MVWTYIPTKGGEQLPVWEQKPTTKANGAAVIVLHEAFRVTPHIMRMADWLAGEGYRVMVPDVLFRSAPAREALPQNKLGLDEARALISKTSPDDNEADMNACVKYLNKKGYEKVGLIGYCYGGSLAYFGGTKLNVQAVDAYYGGMLAELAGQGQPTCPTQVHLAVLDQYIPLEATKAAIEKHHPAAEVFVYEADHGFNRDDGVTFDETASALARKRTLDLFDKYLK